MTDSCNTTQVGSVHVVTSFKEGDVICSKGNWDGNLPSFFMATNQDVNISSGKGKEYVMISKYSS